MKRLLLLSMILLACSSSRAQYSYRAPEAKENKLKLYDSSENFSDLTCSYDPKSLIGQEVYFVMQNPEKKAKHFDDLLYTSFTGANSKTYKGVTFFNEKRTPYSALAGKTFLITDYGSEKTDDKGYCCKVHSVLKDPEGEMVQWNFYISYGNVGRNRDEVPGEAIYTKAYLEQLKKNWVNKKVYAKGDTLPYTCTELTFIFDKDEYFARPRLVLKRADGEKLIAPEKMNDFQNEEAYKAAMEQKRQEDAAQAAKEKADEADAKKNAAETLATYVKQFGKVYGTAVANRQVKIGMTKAMCEAAWGDPDHTSTGKTIEVWHYSDGSMLTFTNGKLSHITE